MKAPFDKIIVALDYEDPAKAYALVDTLGEDVSWYKIGPALFTRSGTDAIRFLHSRGKKIFVDLKLHDTPYVVSSTIAQLAEMGVRMATLHTLGGKQMLLSAATACRGSSMKLLGISLLTSHSPKDYELLGWTGRSGEIMEKLVGLALETRLSGIVCSPHELALVQAQTLPGFLKISAGIRIPGQEVFGEDQQRVASANQAIDLGADFLVVGRPISQSRDPKATLNQLFLL